MDESEKKLGDIPQASAPVNGTASTPPAGPADPKAMTAVPVGTAVGGALAPPDKGADGTGAKKGFDVRLLLLCLVLWAVAVVVLVANWGDIKRNYYWGNIKEGLDNGQGLDMASVNALVAMGDDVVPSCEEELETHPSLIFKMRGVVKVLELIPTRAAHDVLAAAVSQQDQDTNLSANAFAALKDRLAKLPQEKDALLQLARERVKADKRIPVRAIAALYVDQNGDVGVDKRELAALLVFDAGQPTLRRDVAPLLEQLLPDAPKLRTDWKPEDLGEGGSFAKEMETLHFWCHDHGIVVLSYDPQRPDLMGVWNPPAPVASGGTAAPDSSSKGRSPLGK